MSLNPGKAYMNDISLEESGNKIYYPKGRKLTLKVDGFTTACYGAKLTYQWKVNKTGEYYDWKKIKDATSPGYTFKKTAGIQQYKCVISDGNSILEEIFYVSSKKEEFGNVISLNVKKNSTVAMCVGQSTGEIKAEKLLIGDEITQCSSSNNGVVAVSIKDKKIMLQAGSKTGTATITVETSYKESFKFKVKVRTKKIKTSSISVPEKKITLKKKKTYQIEAVRLPVTTQDSIKYVSSNKKIATVTSTGKIKALKSGKATITVKSGTRKVKIKLVVK